MSTNLLPQCRRSGIVDHSHEREILIYDLEIHKAYNLNETLALVYQACDGKTSFDELKKRHRLSDDVIRLSLAQLAENNLLESSDQSALKGLNRREVIRRAGLASMMALPMLTMIAAPRAAQASSLTNLVCATPGGQLCATQPDCAGYCNTNLVRQCDCILNCCVECSFSATSQICAGVCLETASDPNNCGGCGVVCQGLDICVAGVCVPTV